MLPPAMPQPADPENLPAWRAAVLAYRRVLRETNDEAHARHAATDAYLVERPDLDRAEAAARAARAIAYASAHHTEWFWRGITQAEKTAAAPANEGGGTAPGGAREKIEIAPR